MRWLKRFFSDCSRISRTRGNSRSRPFRPVLERLENRLAPSVTRTLGTQEITVVEEPVTTWSSDSSVARSESNKVPENDAIIATQGVTYGFTRTELSASRSDAGHTHVQILSWREDDLISDHLVASTTTTYEIKPNLSTSVVYAPKVFQTTVGAWTGTLEGDTVEFKVRVHTGFWEANLDSDQLWLTEGALEGGVQAPSRMGTLGVGYASEYFHTWWAPSPGGIGNFKVYTFDSPDGYDFEVKGFNDTGYSLLEASSDRLVETAEEKLVFDPSVTFESVYTRNE